MGRFKADCTGFKEILSLADRRSFVLNWVSDRPSDVPKGADTEEDSWDFEGMMTAEDVAMSGIRAKLREFQRVCENSGEAVLTTIAKLSS